MNILFGKMLKKRKQQQQKRKTTLKIKLLKHFLKTDDVYILYIHTHIQQKYLYVCIFIYKN